MCIFVFVHGLFRLDSWENIWLYKYIFKSPWCLFSFSFIHALSDLITTFCTSASNYLSSSSHLHFPYSLFLPNLSLSSFSLSPLPFPSLFSSSTSVLNFKLKMVDSQYYLPNEIGVASLDCSEAFRLLSPQEKLYAHYLSRAAWYVTYHRMLQVQVEHFWNQFLTCFLKNTDLRIE